MINKTPSHIRLQKQVMLPNCPHGMKGFFEMYSRGTIYITITILKLHSDPLKISGFVFLLDSKIIKIIKKINKNINYDKK